MVNLVRFFLRFLLNDTKLRYYSKFLEEPLQKMTSGNVVRAAVIQMNYSPVSGIGNFVELVNQYLEKMRNFSPQIIVFPNLLDTIIFGTFPAFFYLKGRRTVKLIKSCSSITSYACEKIMAELSNKWQCTVVFGTTVGQFVYHCGVKQKNVFSTSNYKIAVLPKRDIVNSEKLERYIKDGVRIIATTGCGVVDFNEWDDRFSMWVHSQMVGFYGLWSLMSGIVFGKEIKGRACVTAPVPITRSQDGYIVKSNTLQGDVVLLAELDMQKIDFFLLSRAVSIY
ncbi:hypothetical protein [Pseudothermotoga elfii]